MSAAIVKTELICTEASGSARRYRQTWTIRNDYYEQIIWPAGCYLQLDAQQNMQYASFKSNVIDYEIKPTEQAAFKVDVQLNNSVAHAAGDWSLVIPGIQFCGPLFRCNVEGVGLDFAPLTFNSTMGLKDGFSISLVSSENSLIVITQKGIARSALLKSYAHLKLGYNVIIRVQHSLYTIQQAFQLEDKLTQDESISSCPPLSDYGFDDGFEQWLRLYKFAYAFRLHATRRLAAEQLWESATKFEQLSSAYRLYFQGDLPSSPTVAEQLGVEVRPAIPVFLDLISLGIIVLRYDLYSKYESGENTPYHHEEEFRNCLQLVMKSVGPGSHGQRILAALEQRKDVTVQACKVLKGSYEFLTPDTWVAERHFRNRRLCEAWKPAKTQEFDRHKDVPFDYPNIANMGLVMLEVTAKAWKPVDLGGIILQVASSAM